MVMQAQAITRPPRRPHTTPAAWFWGIVPKTKYITHATDSEHCKAEAQAKADGRLMIQPANQKTSDIGANTSGANRMLKLSGCSNCLNL